MDASHASRARHYLGRLAVVGAVALGAPVALAGVADAAPEGSLGPHREVRERW